MVLMLRAIHNLVRPIVFMAGLVLFTAIPAGATAEIKKGTLGVSLNYPGVGARYFLANDLCVEARSQIEQDVFFAGGRVCRYFSPVTGVFPYGGAEAGYASYKGDSAVAGGYAISIFVGGEYFMWPKVSAQFDFGPAYVGLKDDDMSLSVGGIEYVMNFGFTYYFGR
jgi:hypothetical protein